MLRSFAFILSTLRPLTSRVIWQVDPVPYERNNEQLLNPMAKLNTKQFEQFSRDGYLMIRELFDAEEMNLLLQIARSDQLAGLR